MKRATIYLLLGLAILGLCVSPPAIADEGKEEAAVTAAQTGLALIDEGKYGESWDTAAQYFKNAIAKEKWEQMLSAVRKPLGKLLFREPINRSYTQSLPGAPDKDVVNLNHCRDD